MNAVDWSVWGPPLLVLGLGGVAGLGLVLTGRSAPAVEDNSRLDLEARRQVLLTALHELEADRPKLEEAVYLSRREALLAEAAAVLRALDEGPAPRAQATPRPTTGARGLAYGVGAVLFLALAGLVLQQSVKPRDDGGGAGMGAAVGPEVRLAELQAQLSANPQDLDALNALTRLALETQQLDLAMQTLDRARAIDPEHPAVLTHFGALLIFIGRDQQAEEQLRAALARQPGFGEARLWLMVVLANRGELEQATAEARALAADPTASMEDRMAAGSMLQSLSAVASRASSAASPGGASDAAPVGPPRVSGRVTAPPDLPPGGVLFVYVRSSEVPAGRPLAAKRVPDWALPLDFTLSDADLLAGGDWPEQVWLQAKVSRSGDPMQRSPEDVASAVVGPLAPGATDVQLVLTP